MSQVPISPDIPEPPPIPPVPPIEPTARRRSPIVVIAVVAGVIVVAGVAVVLVHRSSSVGSFSAHGVSSTFPSTWQEGTPTFDEEAGSKLWVEGFAPGPGNDIVSVAAYSLSPAAATATVDQLQRALHHAFSGLVSSVGGTVTSAVHATQLGEHPVFAASSEDSGSTGEVLTDDTFVIDGTTEYVISCQYHASTRSEISSGCQQILDSFSIGSSSPEISPSPS